MYHLLHDPRDPGSPFEMFHENPPHSTCYRWFHPTDSSADYYGNPDSAHPFNTYNVSEWCADVAGGSTYVLHSFPTQPTPAEILAAIHLHPELLI
jgi:hypothetical protein